MTLPFTPAQFVQVFRLYNEAIWPLQWLLQALAVLALAALWWRPRESGTVVSAVLALLWLWTGAAYHLGFFRSINPAAVVFGALSLVGAGLFFWHGVLHGRLTFERPQGWLGLGAAVTIVYALLIYPAISLATGHAYPESPTFGTPCPTTLFTLGVLLLTSRHPPLAPFCAPILWAAIGTQAAISLDVPQDYGLSVAAVLVLLHLRRRSKDPR